MFLKVNKDTLAFKFFAYGRKKAGGNDLNRGKNTL